MADDINYSYFASGGLGGDYLSQEQHESSATGPTYVTTNYAEYDAWGIPKQTKAPDAKLTCRTFDAKSGLTASVRSLVGTNQTDCTSTNSGDETTSYSYDSHRRLTLTTKPRSNCIARTYDANGLLSVVKEEDFVTSACSSTGNTMNYFYDADGLNTKIEWDDTTPTVTRRQEYTYGADRRTSTIVNPVNTAKKQTLSYYDDGVAKEIDPEDYVAGQVNDQITFSVDSLNRETALSRYIGGTGSANETFTITPGVQLDLPTRIADPASHNLDLKWDDLHRKVKQVTPEGAINYYVYDEAGNQTIMVMASGTTDSKETDYSYDNMNRLTAVDTGDANCTAGSYTNHQEIQYFYDGLPPSPEPGCPTGSNCLNLAGHLGAVKMQIYCDNNITDGSFDQWTYYSYTDDGHIAEHTVHDDGARNGRVVYAYDKNGNETRMDPPAGSLAGTKYTYDDSTISSDADRVASIQHDTYDILKTIKWNPFGPIAEHTGREAFLHTSTYYMTKTTFTRNLAYRLTQINAQSTFSTPDPVFKIDFAEDVRGRYTQRDFSSGSASQKDMFFLYDALNRTTCRTTASVTPCPTTPGGTNQFETLTYNTSSDRTQLLLNNALIARATYNTNYVSGSDEIDCIRSDASACAHPVGTGPEIDFTFDTRGNRTKDDDRNYQTNDDKRSYTYDGRNNLITVTGTFWYATSTLHSYLVTYAYDERNNQIFKSFKDTTANTEAQWFFYYDQFDHVIEAKYTPNISTSTTYSVFDWYWLQDLPFLYYQTDYPGTGMPPTPVVSIRYLHADEQGRPHALWNWPPSGSTSRVWEVEAGLFGWDIPTVGGTLYQPLRFPGQKYDADTEAQTVAGGGGKLVLRAGLTDNQYRVYDSFAGTYLQVDEEVGRTWSSYGYTDDQPVSLADPTGLEINDGKGLEDATKKNATCLGELAGAGAFCEKVGEMGEGSEAGEIAAGLLCAAAIGASLMGCVDGSYQGDYDSNGNPTYPGEPDPEGNGNHLGWRPCCVPESLTYNNDYCRSLRGLPPARELVDHEVLRQGIYQPERTRRTQ